MSGITIKMPISKSDTSPGGFEHIETHRALVRQNFRNLLLTIPGERPMLPKFGIGVAQYLFEPESSISDIESVIFDQVAEYMPFIEVLDLRTSVDDGLGRLSVRYKIIPLEDFDQLNITVFNN